MEAVRPVSPLAGYVGGKRQLARTIIERIGRVEHALYAEPFVGMGGVFLRRPARPKVEAINDYSRDVAIFFRILQRHHQAFLDMLKWQVSSRAEFERLNAQDPETLTDLERAARFLYLQRLSFGGKVSSRTFGIDTNTGARFDITRLVPLLEAAHERLAGVWIDCLPWAEFIRRWDRPGTLFVRDEFVAIAGALQGLQGRFILSINDVPEIREIFSWADVDEVALSYVAGGGGNAKAARELIITDRRA